VSLFVCIPQDGTDPNCMPVNTLEEIEAARALLIEAGIGEAVVWSGDPDDPDAVETSQRLLAEAIAAIGSDGTRLVVWGVGATEDAATRDAARWLHIDRDTTPLCFAEIDTLTLARIVTGAVDCELLGLQTPELLREAKRAGVR
jgi:hypothetical protein